MNIKFTKDIIALICTGIVTIGFFVAGIFKVLDYLIVRAVLFGLFFGLILLVATHGKWSASEMEQEQTEE